MSQQMNQLMRAPSTLNSCGAAAGLVATIVIISGGIMVIAIAIVTVIIIVSICIVSVIGLFRCRC
jgi:hypothetical protein